MIHPGSFTLTTLLLVPHFCDLIAYICCLLVSALESFGGQRLLQRADINVGSNVVTFFRIRARTTGKVGGKDLRQLTCFGE